jgi:hypothetical protein
VEVVVVETHGVQLLVLLLVEVVLVDMVVLVLPVLLIQVVVAVEVVFLGHQGLDKMVRQAALVSLSLKSHLRTMPHSHLV